MRTLALKHSAILVAIFLFIVFASSPCLADQKDKGMLRLSSETPVVSAEVGVGDLYALVVGVSNYRHAAIPQLTVSDKDAFDFAEFLRSQKVLFKKINVTLLTNEQATKAELEDQLIYGLRKAGKDDTVIIFLSGHGADDPLNPGEFFFLTHDADPQKLAVTSVHMNRQWFLERLDSKRVLLITDACHAGGFSVKGIKALPPSMQSLLSRFRESEGKILLSSSRSDEHSRELSSMGNSLFTHYLLEALKGEADVNKDGVVTLDEAYHYVYRKVKEKSEGFQSPQKAGQVIGEFPLAFQKSTSENPNTDGSGQFAARPRDRSESDLHSGFQRQQREIAAPVEADKKYPAHLMELIAKAEQGDSFAQRTVGLTFVNGLGVEKDFTQARKYFHMAVDQGDGEAAYHLGEMLELGSGVPKNPARAWELYRLAARNGFPEAEKRLIEKKIESLKESAATGDTDAQMELSLQYNNPTNRLYDCKESEKWLIEAATGGNSRAMYELGGFYLKETSKYTFCSRLDKQQALRWLRKAASSGIAAAAYELGRMYEEGRHVTKERAEALKWYKKAADLGHDFARQKVNYRNVYSD